MSKDKETTPPGGDSNGYPVGYCRPPKHSQFRPGHSGNPAGRRPGLGNFVTDVKSMLGTPVKVKEGGRTRTRSTQQGVLMVLREKALRGDARALDRFVELAVRVNSDAAEVGSAQALAADDQAILAAYVAEQVAAGTSPVTADENVKPASKPGARSNKNAPK
jgi:Family of unknown function (DUF5681)